MPTIIKVQHVRKDGSLHPTFINADQIVAFHATPFKVEDTECSMIEFADGDARVSKNSPDEIAALIAEAMNPLGADYKLPEWAREREADLPEDTNVVPLPKLKPVMPEDNIARVPDYKWPEWERNLGSGIVPGTPKE